MKPLRVALVDSLLEQHVIESLAGALRRRGHDVFATGKLSHGDSPVDNGEYVGLLAAGMRKIREFSPDLVLLFRPQSWPVEYSRELRRMGAKVAAWMSDGPVLFKTGYARSLEEVDLVLVTGHEPVLEFFDSSGLFAKSVNFPFWAEATESVEAKRPIRRGIFIGNVHDSIRGGRAELLGALGDDVAVFGKATPDQKQEINWGGTLVGRSEIHFEISRSQIGINFPQVYRTYEGSKYWFDGLAALGGFQTPSRVVQYASAGTPILTLGFLGIGDGGLSAQRIVGDKSELIETFHSLDAGEIRKMSRSTRAEFQQHFTADSRAEYLEWLFHHAEFEKLSVSSRVALYRNFREADIAHTRPGFELETAIKKDVSQLTATTRFVTVFGEGWAVQTSSLYESINTVRSLGYEVRGENPYDFKQDLVRDPFGDFLNLIPYSVVRERGWLQSAAIIVVGSAYGFTREAWATIREADVPVIVIEGDTGRRAATRQRLGARAAGSLTLRPDSADVYFALGLSHHQLWRQEISVKNQNARGDLVKIGEAEAAGAIYDSHSTTFSSNFLRSKPAMEKFKSSRVKYVYLRASLSNDRVAAYEIIRFTAQQGAILLFDIKVANDLGIEPQMPHRTVSGEESVPQVLARMNGGRGLRKRRVFEYAERRSVSIGSFIEMVIDGKKAT